MMPTRRASTSNRIRKYDTNGTRSLFDGSTLVQLKTSCSIRFDVGHAAGISTIVCHPII